MKQKSSEKPKDVYAVESVGIAAVSLVELLKELLEEAAEERKDQ